jgi:tetratricopeptide (TPR) repeat protein
VAKKRVSKTKPQEKGALTFGICFVLFVLTWIVFGQTTGFTFINYDDGLYVYGNPEVTKGLSLHGIAWAFTHVHGGNWHPLTSISHLLDCQLYGLNAGAHHFTNVLLHSIAVVLLFLALEQMTGARWRSAVVAALFAIHPLRAESVAWIAERKDVLSGVFFMLTLLTYVRYARKPSAGRYWVIPCVFALGLMSKPMLVTVPFILLLLDYWPLGRLRNFSFAQTKAGNARNARSVQQLLVEKIPFFILSALSCVATLLAQRGAIATAEQLSIGPRIFNAFLSCVVYLGQMFWPFRLGLFYPFPEYGLLAKGLLSAVLLILISAIVFVFRKTHPYLITGWLWYLGMLVPVIGIVQVGMQAHADRYTYLSQIGLSLALVWGVTDVARSWRHRREILSAAAVVTIVILSITAWIQTSYWADSEKIWGRTLAVAPNSNLAQASFGNALLSKGRAAEAIPYYEKALALRPDDAAGHNTLADALRRSGRLDEAIAQFRTVLELRDRQGDAKKGEAHYNLANALLEKNQIVESIEEYRHAVELEPNNLDYHNNLGNALLRQGLEADAIAEYEKVLTIDPASVAARGNLAWIWATSFNPARRQGFRALDVARQANELSGERDPIILNALAAAYAETGQFTKAVSTAQQALDLASGGNPQLTTLLREEIALFRAGMPYHAPSR